MTDTEQSRLNQANQSAIEDAGPEDRVKHELTMWLADHGCTVYWEKSNAWEHPTFTGGGERPDLIIPDAPIGYRPGVTRVLALEVKTEGGSDVCDGFYQTTRYWRQAVNDEANYQVGGNIIKPSVCALATDASTEGKLFEDDQLRTNWGSSTRQREKGYLPKNEYAGTGMSFRTALRWVAEYREKHSKAARDIGFGALLSSRLDGDSTSRPAVMFWEHDDQGQKDRWRIM